MNKKSNRKALSSRGGGGGKSDFKGWIAFLDIYAFGSHLESAFFSDAELKLLEMHRQLRASISFRAGNSYFMFSDSLVLWIKAVPGDEFALKKFIERISIAQRIAAERDFLFRGSLAYGRVLISQNYILGDAYLRAYKLESEAQIGPQVIIPKSEFENASLLDMFETELVNIKVKGDKSIRAMLLSYVPWEKVAAIVRANVAAIRSSHRLTEEQKTLHVSRWEHIREE